MLVLSLYDQRTHWLSIVGISFNTGTYERSSFFLGNFSFLSSNLTFSSLLSRSSNVSADYQILCLGVILGCNYRGQKRAAVI